MNNPPPASPPHDDGLSELRELRRRLFQQSGGTLPGLGDHYRQVQARHAHRIKDPRQLIANAVHST